jgi:Single-strand binding protein family
MRSQFKSWQAHPPISPAHEHASRSPALALLAASPGSCHPRATTSGGRVPRTGRRRLDQLVQGGCDGSVPPSHDVLIAQRRGRGGMAHRRAMFRVAVSGRRDQEPSFFTVIAWRDQAEHAAESLAKGSRVVVLGRLQQRTWTAEDGAARSVVEVVAEELGPSLRWATATATRATRSPER